MKIVVSCHYIDSKLNKNVLRRSYLSDVFLFPINTSLCGCGGHVLKRVCLSFIAVEHFSCSARGPPETS